MNLGDFGIGSIGGYYSGGGSTTIVFCILAVLGGLAIYFLFATPKNEGKFTGFAGWLYDFARFTKNIAVTLLKITYFIVAIFITLQALYLLFINFGTGIMLLIVGNLVLRIIYELILVLLSIHENLVAIRKRIAPPEIQEESVPEQDDQADA